MVLWLGSHWSILIQKRTGTIRDLTHLVQIFYGCFKYMGDPNTFVRRKMKDRLEELEKTKREPRSAAYLVLTSIPVGTRYAHTHTHRSPHRVCLLSIVYQFRKQSFLDPSHTKLRQETQIQWIRQSAIQHREPWQSLEDQQFPDLESLCLP